MTDRYLIPILFPYKLRERYKDSNNLRELVSILLGEKIDNIVIEGNVVYLKIDNRLVAKYIVVDNLKLEKEVS